MNARAFALLICVGLAAVSASPSAAQGTPASKSTASGSKSSASTTKPPLSEIRPLVHKLQGHTDKLQELMTQYRSLVEQRPQPAGGSPEAKKSHEAQLAKWSAALDRLLLRIDEARAPVVEGKQQLDRLAVDQLPTALAKDVVNAQNEADAARTDADQALAKRKPAAPAAKPTKKPEAPAPSSELDDL
jgi:hypothetical protein